MDRGRAADAAIGSCTPMINPAAVANSIQKLMAPVPAGRHTSGVCPCRAWATTDIPASREWQLLGERLGCWRLHAAVCAYWCTRWTVVLSPKLLLPLLLLPLLLVWLLLLLLLSEAACDPEQAGG